MIQVKFLNQKGEIFYFEILEGREKICDASFENDRNLGKLKTNVRLSNYDRHFVKALCRTTIDNIIENTK